MSQGVAIGLRAGKKKNLFVENYRPFFFFTAGSELFHKLFIKTTGKTRVKSLTIMRLI